jgi:ubiquinone biosynthesis monooxygenase Coq7
MTQKNTLHGADRIISELDVALRSLFSKPIPQRTNPADENNISEIQMSDQETAKSIELMRINHVGEVCAQALYQGQAMTAKSEDIKNKMKGAAQEEIDHLSWCEDRLNELGGRPSLLNPAWYAGSLLLGATAGMIGDKWSLGFLQETETQVEQHLAGHLDELPKEDNRSRAIVEQMKIDEAEHAQMAQESGAAELPLPIKGLMTFSAKAMKMIAAKI